MKRFLFSLSSTLVIVFGAVQAFHTAPVAAAGVCCDTSADCPGDQICLNPIWPQRDCSLTKVGYCSIPSQ